MDGMFVSNHGGRQLDGVAGAVDALPTVAEAVAGRAALILDGGIRRGAHIIKALALGADCCSIGRPQFWGLSVAGEAGVAHVFDIFRRELDLTMGLCGLPNVASIGPDVLARGTATETARLTAASEAVAAAAVAVAESGNAANNGDGDGSEEPVEPVAEVGGPAGPEPTRYGDWERKGRAIDF